MSIKTKSIITNIATAFSNLPDYKHAILIHQPDYDEYDGENPVADNHCPIMKVNVPGYLMSTVTYEDQRAESGPTCMIASDPGYLVHPVPSTFGTFQVTSYPKYRAFMFHAIESSTLSSSVLHPIIPGTSTYITTQFVWGDRLYSQMFFVPCCGVYDYCKGDTSLFVSYCGRVQMCYHTISTQMCANITSKRIQPCFANRLDEWTDNFITDSSGNLSVKPPKIVKRYKGAAYISGYDVPPVDPVKTGKECCYYHRGATHLHKFVTSSEVDTILSGMTTDQKNAAASYTVSSYDFQHYVLHRGPIYNDLYVHISDLAYGVPDGCGSTPIARVVRYNVDGTSVDITSANAAAEITAIKNKSLFDYLNYYIVYITRASAAEAMRDRWCMVHSDWYNQGSLDKIYYAYHIARKKNVDYPPTLADLPDGDFYMTSFALWWYLSPKECLMDYGVDLPHTKRHVCYSGGHMDGSYVINYDPSTHTFELIGDVYFHADNPYLYFNAVFKNFDDTWVGTSIGNLDTTKYNVELTSLIRDDQRWSYDKMKPSTDATKYDDITINKTPTYVQFYGTHLLGRAFKLRITGSVTSLID